MLYVMGAILLFLVILFIRAAMFLPNESQAFPIEAVQLDETKIISDLTDMIRCKTVSHPDDEWTDKEEFEKFRSVLALRFPNVHTKTELNHIGKTGLLYHWRGKKSNAPCVLMSHYDVVPVEEDVWQKPPFEGVLENGVLWGRGTLDTKTTLLGVIYAAEQLLETGFVPEQDIWLAFSGDEEVMGVSCPLIVAELEKRGVKPAMVLDEGGAIVENVFPGVTKPAALVGIAEKGLANVSFSMESRGGHASTPPVHTIIGKLAQAVVAVESHPFRSKLTKPVAELFDTLGRHAGFGWRILFANLWCFQPLLDLFCRISGGELNAMLRTTCAFTQMSGSKAGNVLPPKADITANMRLIGGDTLDTIMTHLNKVVHDPDVHIHLIAGMNPSISSDTNCTEWNKLKQVIKSTWPEAIVSPYLMMQCSDSRHFCRITDRVYRFSAMSLTKQERSTIHGHDERVPVETVLKTVAFYQRLILQL